MKANIAVRSVLIFIITTSLAACYSGVNRSNLTPQQVLVRRATMAVRHFAMDSNMDWFRNNLSNASGLLIVPELVKGGLIFGGSGGRGVFLMKDHESGEWIGPAFYNLASANWGLQIGGQIAEMMILVMTESGLENMYSSTFKLGGDVTVALGPVGAGVSGSVAAVTADYLSFARTKGAYAGLVLDGAVMMVNSDWNHAYYGRPAKPLDILLNRRVSNMDAEQLKTEIGKIDTMR